jgi:uncharacterized protein
VGGGTAWAWARPGSSALDVLVVDEAGQLLATPSPARAAKSLILLGDPQQLEQPIQGSHPEGADRSALEHLLEGKETIQDDHGLFLTETWRLHPSIGAFTSEIFYEGRLGSRRTSNDKRSSAARSGCGPGTCRLTRGQPEQPPQGRAVGGIVDQLLGRRFVDRPKERAFGRGHLTGTVQRPGRRDRRRLSRRVGTVDKFQGQRRRSSSLMATSSSRTRRAAGVSLQPESPERRNLARALRLHPGGEPAPLRARVPDTAADAAGERAVQVSGAGAFRMGTDLRV